jgi:hypothetical protein
MAYIAKEDADIVALQETKCDKDKLPDEVNLPGYHNYFLDSKIYKCSIIRYVSCIIIKFIFFNRQKTRLLWDCFIL